MQQREHAHKLIVEQASWSAATSTNSQQRDAYPASVEIEKNPVPTRTLDGELVYHG
jgi:hypothetical protein